MSSDENDFSDQTPDDCWKWMIFYVNRDDPRVVVPKRFGFGYTLNFARKSSYLIVAAILALVVFPIAKSFIG
ncbi:MAG TPA: DUF5808 domain-containing protein [Gammaproteobacteria bacterium]|nr:DUF5808 domain-containing protein [Gammaproteobacteria bacterium]